MLLLFTAPTSRLVVVGVGVCFCRCRCLQTSVHVSDFAVAS